MIYDCVCGFAYVLFPIYFVPFRNSESANIFHVENCAWLYERRLGIIRAREITAIVLLRKIKVAIEKCYKTLRKHDLAKKRTFLYYFLAQIRHSIKTLH